MIVSSDLPHKTRKEWQDIDKGLMRTLLSFLPSLWCDYTFVGFRFRRGIQVEPFAIPSWNQIKNPSSIFLFVNRRVRYEQA